MGVSFSRALWSPPLQARRSRLTSPLSPLSCAVHIPWVKIIPRVVTPAEMLCYRAQLVIKVADNTTCRNGGFCSGATSHWEQLSGICLELATEFRPSAAHACDMHLGFSTPPAGMK